MVSSLSAFPTVVLGDLHGRLELLRQALIDLELMDGAGRWTGGTRRLVQLGDVVDRGPEPLGCLDLLMELQAEARAAGGDVICLIGNHEFMALRAAAGEHESRLSWIYNGAGAELKQWAARQGRCCDETALPYPEEFFAAFGPASAYGRWIRTHQVACRVGEYVVVHAGWTPDCPASVEEANAIFTAAAADADPQVFLAATAPLDPLLWARGQSETEIAAACGRLRCRGLIAGHSVKPGILTTCGGQLTQIDVGMWYNGTWAALGADAGGSLWALVQGRKPVRIAGDGQVAVPPAAPAVPVAATSTAIGTATQPATDATPEPAHPGPRYRAGDLVRIYRSDDGAWSQYLLVEGSAQFHGFPAYAGQFLTYRGGYWTVEPSVYFCERVDRFGRPAAPGEVPDDLLPANRGQQAT